MRNLFVDDKFASDDQRFKDLKEDMETEFSECGKKFLLNDIREEDTQK